MQYIGNCSGAIAEVHNVSSQALASWSYGRVPLVNECDLLMADCHPNATCVDTPDGFVCTCNRGFTGNGKDTCNRT